MKLIVPKEVAPGETRVAAVPDTVKRLMRAGLEVAVEAGAGAGSFQTDEAYREAGASIEADASALFSQADLVIKILAPETGPDAERDEVQMLPEGSALVALLNPTRSGELVRGLAERKVTSFSLDALPRITRAQSMDVLSSMSTLAGYKAVLIAADTLGKILPMMMTAAGTVQPANVLVIGAGVAGLQAIATARRLGAVVKAIDTRPAVQEQVETLGARFVALEVAHEAEDTGGYARDLGEEFYKGEQEIIAPHLREADIVVTTALIPGRPAPVLITAQMLAEMMPGSVVVDLAAPAGGNCTETSPDETVEHAGVTVLGPTNLPATLPVHASWMLARNVATFVEEITSEGKLNFDEENEIVTGTLITHDGEVVHDPTRKALGMDEE